MLEMKIAIAMLLQHFSFAIAPGYEKIVYTRAVTLQTPLDFKIVVNKLKH
jgi:hypothetical protein